MPSYQNSAPIYYYHPDHLGIVGPPTRLCDPLGPQTAPRFHFADFVTTTWVTDESGTEQQFLAYLPYGEPLLDEHLKIYDGRHGPDDILYKFTGKERDADAFFSHITWTNEKKTTGSSEGRIFIKRDKDVKGK
ncbi:MAG: hypothetical protein IJU36_03605 [Paludibacteraceae bacterium]|nr:hypothetical protein [Paludibacteraceae bacterium]